ncbi:MAG TPA: alkaline phosphatase [Thermoanaerobaculia bacterium]|nr:alkaline phosphatase [Thermoanaerobaculia bacterium]
MTRTILALLCFLFCTFAGAAEAPRSILFLIADGAAISQFTVTRILRGAEFQTGRLPSTGLVATSPLPDSIVTDSAAAATAYATGVRTNYRAVGVDPSGRSHKTVLERAEELGKSTGLVTTTNFWDATPAAFAAHTPSRYDTDIIIGQMLSSGAAVIAGGGVRYFGVEGRPTLEEVADASAYTLIRTREELESATGERFLAVFPTEDQEVDFEEVRLPVLARWAIEKVAGNPEGFFLMIEHEGADGAAHVNMTDEFVASLISFDETVGVALDFASARDDVLVLVTGDHETGGLQIHRERGTEMELRWTTKGHTGEAVPIFAFGPGAGEFTGFMSGEDVGKKILRLLR